MTQARVILDTNVFVAAGFKQRSASARIIDLIRTGQLRMVWHEQTRRETEHILRKIPPISWRDVKELFREEDRYPDSLAVADFTHILDPDDRKYAALSEVTGVCLLTNDSDLLEHRDQARTEILTPREYCDWHEH